MLALRNASPLPLFSKVELVTLFFPAIFKSFFLLHFIIRTTIGQQRLQSSNDRSMQALKTRAIAAQPLLSHILLAVFLRVSKSGF